MKHDSSCPICGEGLLTEKISYTEKFLSGKPRLIPLHSSVCQSCESEFATPTQTRANKRAMIAFDKEEEGLLTGSQVKRIREKLRLTRSEAARIFGGGPVAFNKYENNDICQSTAMDKLLRLAANLPEAFDYLVAGCPEAIDSQVLYENEATSVEYRMVKEYEYTQKISLPHMTLEPTVQYTNYFSVIDSISNEVCYE